MVRFVNAPYLTRDSVNEKKLNQTIGRLIVTKLKIIDDLPDHNLSYRKTKPNGYPNLGSHCP